MKEHLRGHKFADDDEVMEVVQSWLKATPKSFFSRGHPQACGQVDRVCCVAGGTVSENKTQKTSVSTLVKSYYKIPVI
jgi:hypothetical protein